LSPGVVDLMPILVAGWQVCYKYPASIVILEPHAGGRVASVWGHVGKVMLLVGNGVNSPVDIYFLVKAWTVHASPWQGSDDKYVVPSLAWHLIINAGLLSVLAIGLCQVSHQQVAVCLLVKRHWYNFCSMLFAVGNW